jgi:hypothetical protein
VDNAHNVFIKAVGKWLSLQELTPGECLSKVPGAQKSIWEPLLLECRIDAVSHERAMVDSEAALTIGFMIGMLVNRWDHLGSAPWDHENAYGESLDWLEKQGVMNWLNRLNPAE